MCFLGYVAERNSVGVRLDGKKFSSGLVLDLDGAILVYSCVSHGRMGGRRHELVPGQPVTLPQIYESKRDIVVQGRNFAIISTYRSVKNDEFTSVHCKDQQISSRRRLHASLTPSGQAMISQPRMLDKQVLSVR